MRSIWRLARIDNVGIVGATHLVLSFPAICRIVLVGAIERFPQTYEATDGLANLSPYVSFLPATKRETKVSQNDFGRLAARFLLHRGAACSLRQSHAATDCRMGRSVAIRHG